MTLIPRQKLIIETECADKSCPGWPCDAMKRSMCDSYMKGINSKVPNPTCCRTRPRYVDEPFNKTMADTPECPYLANVEDCDYLYFKHCRKSKVVDV